MILCVTFSIQNVQSIILDPRYFRGGQYTQGDSHIEDVVSC